MTTAPSPINLSPTDVDSIQALSAQQQAQLHIQQQQISQQAEQIKALQHQLTWFKRQLFGEKSEKRNLTDNPFQHTIAELLQTLPVIPDQPESKQTITYQRGTAKKNALAGTPDDSGLRFDETVPVEEIQLSAPELAGPNAADYEVISHKVTYRLAQRPGSQVVLKYTRPVLKKKSTQALITVPAPANVLDKSFADVSFLVSMLLDKFLYHQPLHRQHQKLAANGIVVARSTLTNLSQRAIELVKPVYAAQWHSALRSRVLAMDETPVKAGRDKPGKLKTAYFWPVYGDQDEVCFSFSASRSMQHLTSQLSAFSGTLVTDGYGAYARYCHKNEDLTHAQCWVHSRRYFEWAQDDEPQACAIALELIGRLYHCEEAICEQQLSGHDKLLYRVEYAKPIVEHFFNWCDEQCQRPDLVNSNPLSKALKYVRKRQGALSVFLSDPDVPLDTNHLERALRVVPMGRRNWLFAWTEIGAEHIGIIQSILVTCKLHGVNAYDYLVDVLQRISTHPASRVDELTPRLWKEKFAENPLRSDLYKASLRRFE